MADQPNIEETVIAAILAGKIQPGARLGEAMLAELFNVSRTRVREAMMKMEARGIVRVCARRGWFVIEPSAAEARAAFHARKVVETGLLRSLRTITPEALAALRRHVEQERIEVQSGDAHARTCALSDFHVHLASAVGNPLLTDILQDLTARTVLVSMLYQSNEDAAASNGDHAGIIDALEMGDFHQAAALMAEHIDRVESSLDLTTKPDHLAGLRRILSPVLPAKNS
ncbi:GntR family transcriptional regulator [Microvirga sp. VF16]|uniref:GntR family transcriptional regulator n=1 Tax=Microvirga sp. VF16 TaxID=2807101 RepID=UPI00193CC8AB|nr:GntR family transcriptional regulator [Microvirga sp. VF16]QRM35668.1 GntR family transcriptional regulator [Microvirga sp. VF16]